MSPTYEEYLQMPKSLPCSEMQELHGQILSSIGTDPEAQELYNELIGASITYASIRAKWLALSREEKASADSRRTSAHDSLITHINMLARYLKMQGNETAWRNALGDEKEAPNNRKRIGDFGCYLTFVNSLVAR